MRVYKIDNQEVSVLKRSFVRPDLINERSTCSFTVIEPAFEIIEGMEVEVEQDSEIIFAGTVDAVDNYGDIDRYSSVACIDFSQKIDKRVVPKSYVNELAGDIVKDFIADIFSAEGIIEGTIQDGPTISRAIFPYDNGNIAMNRLTEITGYNWEVDYLKRLNFYERSTYSAPFSLTDTSQNYKNMRVKRTRKEYRNTQFVRGGLDTTQEIEKELPTPKPDGVSKSFFTRYPLAQRPRIYIDSVEVPEADIGILGIDSSKKFYFQYNSNRVIQDENETPLDTEVIEITYRGLRQLLVVASNVEEVDARAAIEGDSGIYESITEEPNIDTRDAAFELANGKLDKYGIIPRIVTFQTTEHGLRAGQLLSITNTRHNLNDNFLIESVTARDDDNIILYDVKALDGASLGGWEMFFKRLIQGSRRLVIRENEVLILLTNISEKWTWKESLSIRICKFDTPQDDEYVFITPEMVALTGGLYPDDELYPGVCSEIEVIP